MRLESGGINEIDDSTKRHFKSVFVDTNLTLIINKQ